MTDKKLTANQVMMVAEAIGTLSGICDALLAVEESDLEPESERKDRVVEALERVWGNRPQSAGVKFSDARLFVAAVMRDCLDRIEAA